MHINIFMRIKRLWYDFVISRMIAMYTLVALIYRTTNGQRIFLLAYLAKHSFFVINPCHSCSTALLDFWWHKYTNIHKQQCRVTINLISSPTVIIISLGCKKIYHKKPKSILIITITKATRRCAVTVIILVICSRSFITLIISASRFSGFSHQFLLTKGQSAMLVSFIVQVFMSYHHHLISMSHIFIWWSWCTFQHMPLMQKNGHGWTGELNASL